MPASIYHSPLSSLHVHCTDEHITAIVFRNEPLEEKNRNHPLLQECIQQLDDYFSGKRKTFDLPLAQPGTPFQQKVWDLLYQIPYGKTVSYQQLAMQYGDLKAIRAVASANGKNNLAIIIPCHRVIGSNRSLTGYAGGLWRKKWLLEHEAKHYSGIAQLELL